MGLHRTCGNGGLLGALAWTVASLLFGGEAPDRVRVTQQGTKVEIRTEAAVDAASLRVHPVRDAQLGPPLMGRSEMQAEGLAFIPVAPLPAGQRFRASWRSGEGKAVHLDFTSEAARQIAPKVSLSPQATLPANALKLYLHFTEPMEQGVFLDRLRLLDGQGKEVLGPFRETELWSPDGKRLTVWFHPGRQKAGVNLNLDEGPVLHPNTEYSLIVAGDWRSSGGVAIGNDEAFEFTTAAADHTCPEMARWEIETPNVGTSEPLCVKFDEGLDPAMLGAALQVRALSASEPLGGRVDIDASGGGWRFHPNEAWSKGAYELHADPALEDFAGNSLEKPFEVDTAAPAREAAVKVRRFRMEVVR